MPLDAIHLAPPDAAGLDAPIPAKAPRPKHRLYTSTEAAQMLGVGQRTIAKYVANGVIALTRKDPRGAYLFSADAIALAKARLKNRQAVATALQSPELADARRQTKARWPDAVCYHETTLQGDQPKTRHQVVSLAGAYRSKPCRDPLAAWQAAALDAQAANPPNPNSCQGPTTA